MTKNNIKELPDVLDKYGRKIITTNYTKELANFLEEYGVDYKIVENRVVEADNKLKSEEKMIGTLDIEIYEKAGVGFAQAKYLVHGFEDLFWTDDIDEALAFLKQSIIGKERSL